MTPGFIADGIRLQPDAGLGAASRRGGGKVKVKF